MQHQTLGNVFNFHRLTFTRFVAATLVIIYHGICLGQNVYPFSEKYFYDIFIHGNLAVIYFFYLSGMIMGFAYSTKKENKRKYFLSRFARIYPMYFVGIILMIIYPIYSHLIDWGMGVEHVSFKMALKDGLRESLSGFIKDLKPYLLNFFLIQTWIEKYRYSISSPNWSLSVEVFFYLIFPFIFKYLKKASLRFLVGSSFLVVLLTLICYFILNDSLKSGIPFWYFNLFYLGICMVLVLEKNQSVNNGLLQLGNMKILSLSLFCFVIVVSIYFKKFDYEATLTPIIMLFVFWIISDSNLSWLEKPGFTILGEISYCMYILHFQITVYAQKVLNYTNTSDTFRFYIIFILILIISYLFFKILEKPMRNHINLKNKN